VTGASAHFSSSSLPFRCSIFSSDLAPGPIDDALIIWLTTYLFVELCPPDVVDEHRHKIEGMVNGSMRDAPDTPENKIDEGDIIDGEYHDE
jgi:hypothetical protein